MFFHCLGKVWGIEPSLLDLWLGISIKETYQNVTCSLFKPRLNEKSIYRINQKKKHPAMRHNSVEFQALKLSTPRVSSDKKKLSTRRFAPFFCRYSAVLTLAN